MCTTKSMGVTSSLWTSTRYSGSSSVCSSCSSMIWISGRTCTFMDKYGFLWRLDLRERRSVQSTELVEFFLRQLNIGCGKVLADMLRVHRHGDRDDPWLSHQPGQRDLVGRGRVCLCDRADRLVNRQIPELDRGVGGQ